MLPLSLAEAPEIAGADYFVVVVIAAIAVGALVFAYFLFNQVMIPAMILAGTGVALARAGSPPGPPPDPAGADG